MPGTGLPAAMYSCPRSACASNNRELGSPVVQGLIVVAIVLTPESLPAFPPRDSQYRGESTVTNGKSKMRLHPGEIADIAGQA